MHRHYHESKFCTGGGGGGVHAPPFFPVHLLHDGGHLKLLMMMVSHPADFLYFS